METITPVDDPTPYRGVGGSGQMSQPYVVISQTSELPPGREEHLDPRQAPLWFMDEPLDGGLDAP